MTFSWIIPENKNDKFKKENNVDWATLVLTKIKQLSTGNPLSSRYVDTFCGRFFNS